jgi:hypothetical protein
MLAAVMTMLAAAPAWGAGGPVNAVQGGAGVSTLDGSVRFVAVGTRHSTVVERIRTASQSVNRWRSVPAGFGIPGVAYDGSNTGLSGDGRRLVLAQSPKHVPPRTSRFLVLDTHRMDVVASFSLPGYFTVDAISPRARWLYFIHYTSARNVYDYEVRAFDLRRGVLLREPVVDPREPDEAMGGDAVTRVSTPDGRWAYTLYVRPNGAPFIHALDTDGRTAACIDLDNLAGADLSGARLRLAGGTLRVLTSAGPQALVDTHTFAVGPPAPEAAVLAVSAIASLATVVDRAVAA